MVVDLVGCKHRCRVNMTAISKLQDAEKKWEYFEAK